jgi:hypothetical protein
VFQNIDKPHKRRRGKVKVKKKKKKKKKKVSPAGHNLSWLVVQM